MKPQVPGVLAAKGLRVLVAVGLTVAVTGYVVGLRESRVESRRGVVYGKSTTDVADVAADMPTIVRYDQLSTNKLGPNRAWTTNLATLTQPVAEVPKLASSADERMKVVADRATRRAFDGAPPFIPHPTVQLSVSACLACHEKGLAVGDKVAPRMSHPLYVNCTQCHVEIKAPNAETWDSSFVAIKAGLGERASLGAPPAMPHPIWMRNDCQSCHGPTGPFALRTTHPERQSCLQCHLATSPLDRVPLARELTRPSP